MTAKELQWPQPEFAHGDETDRALCVGLTHEFLRCDDAFRDFARLAEDMIRRGENRRAAYSTYTAYARFVHHLYEFYLGCAARDFRNTRQLRAEFAERYVMSQAQRILNNRREAILNGTAPSWENHISAYPVEVPENFAREFRLLRNVINGHVSARRASLSLTGFYRDNHKFLYMLYYEAKSWWGREQRDFPDLGEITSFSVMIQDSPPPAGNDAGG